MRETSEYSCVSRTWPDSLASISPQPKSQFPRLPQLQLNLHIKKHQSINPTVHARRSVGLVEHVIDPDTGPRVLWMNAIYRRLRGQQQHKYAPIGQPQHYGDSAETPRSANIWTKKHIALLMMIGTLAALVGLVGVG
jgi:hypothetical protein